MPGPERQRERDALICVPSHDHWPDAVEVGRRHAEHFRALAEPADRSLRSPGQNEWLERLQTEAGNLAAIVNWYLAHDLGPLPHLFGSCGKFGRGAPVSVRPVRGSSNSCPPPACWTRRTGSNWLGHGCACRPHELAAMRRRRALLELAAAPWVSLIRQQPFAMWPAAIPGSGVLGYPFGRRRVAGCGGGRRATKSRITSNVAAGLSVSTWCAAWGITSRRARPSGIAATIS